MRRCDCDHAGKHSKEDIIRSIHHDTPLCIHCGYSIIGTLQNIPIGLNRRDLQNLEDLLITGSSRILSDESSRHSEILTKKAKEYEDLATKIASQWRLNNSIIIQEQETINKEEK